MRPAVELLPGWSTLSGPVTGPWRAVFPASSHADFPGAGHHWVSPDGPYDEHLLRDVGPGDLAVGTVALLVVTSRLSGASASAAPRSDPANPRRPVPRRASWTSLSSSPTSVTGRSTATPTC